MSPARFSVQQAVLVNLLFLVFIFAGAVVMREIPVDVYPDTSLDIAMISTAYVGASSEEVERLVTRKIEDEIEDVRGSDRIVSISQSDISVITVKFREDLSPEDFEAAFDDLRVRLDRVDDLPESAEQPILERLTSDEVMPLLQVGVVNEGDIDEVILRRVALDLKDEIRRLPGVARVRLVGVRDREIHILLDKDRLEKHGLSLQQVAAVLEAHNLNIPAGNLAEGDTEITLRGVGDVSEPEELGDICIVRSPTGAHVRLRDVAEIDHTFERAYWSARINGDPALSLYLSKDHNANSLTVRADVQDCIDRYRANLDVDGIGISIQADGTRIISSRIGILQNNLLVGVALVFAVLWVAVGLRNAGLAIVGIPFSFLCAVIFMRLIGVSLNAVSIFSLVLVSGMIVDDAIVVLENIYHHAQAGRPLREAVIVGTNEVMWPVASATMTTVAAFLPLLVMSGMLGRFFSIVPKTVTVALLASLFECLLILPVHYLDWGPRPAAPRTDAARTVHAFTGWRRTLLDAYDWLLTHVLAVRVLAPVLLVACGLFIWQAERTLTVEMFPSDFPTCVVDYKCRPGMSLEATDEAVMNLASAIDQFKPHAVGNTAVFMGVQVDEDGHRVMRPDIAQMWIEVKSEGDDFNDPTRIMNDIREALLAYQADHPQSGVERFRVWPVRDGPPVGKPVAIRVEHPDYDYARELTERISARLASIPGVYDVSDNLQLGNRELILDVDNERAAERGVTFLDVATALRGAKEGLFVGVFKDVQHDEDVDIKVRYADKYVSNVDQFRDIDIVSPVTGASVKLYQVADLRFDRTYTNRYHYNGKRAVEITADVDNNLTDARLVNETILREFGPLADGDDKLDIIAAGQFAETQASFASLKDSAYIALGLMYLILASQFRSYLQPLVVLTAVLFGVMGMVVGLVVNDYPFSVVTGVAMVGLCGVVVNDAIVLIDFINQLRREGVPLAEAIRTACHRRLRPILLTTITTVVGLAPMAFGVGGYSKIWSPFAMSMCWGLAFSTVLTLVVVPALYYVAEDVKRVVLSLFNRSAEESNLPGTPAPARDASPE